MTPDILFWGIGAVVLVLIVAIFIAKRKKEKEAPAPVRPTEPKPESKPVVEQSGPPLEVDKEEEKKPSIGVSTDVTAKEAIDHIRNTGIEDLRDFVPADEDRVTVQRALQRKLEE